jgi:excisionase family DNA binding protein
MENLFNVKQAAFILKVHPLTIRRYIKEGRLKAVRVGGNVRIKEKDMQEFNKDFTPREQQPKSPFRVKTFTVKSFTNDDPFLRLKGRGARLHLSST